MADELQVLPYLSFDIIQEIILRLPIRSIGQSRLLSKQFNKSTYDYHFKNLLITQRSASATIASGFLLQAFCHDSTTKFVFSFISPIHHPNKDCFNLDFLPRFGMINPVILAVAHNGLVLCQTHTQIQNPYRGDFNPIYFVCKPTAKAYIQLPKPKSRIFLKYFAIVAHGSESESESSINPVLHYSIVCLSERRPKRGIMETSEFSCEVFNSKTWRWKQLEDVILQCGYGRFLFSRYPLAVSASGSVNWLLSDDSVFTFNFKDEQWSNFSLPDSVSKRMSSGCKDCRNKKDDFFTLTSYEGKLAFICMDETGSSMEVFVLEEYRRKVWKKIKVIRLIRIADDDDDDKKYSYSYSPKAFYSSDGVVMLKRSSESDKTYQRLTLTYHNLKENGIFCSSDDNEITTLMSVNHIRPHLFPFWSDFEPCTFSAKSGCEQMREQEQQQ